MKKTIIYLAVSLISLAGYSQQQSTQTTQGGMAQPQFAERSYPAALTLNEWQSVLDIIDNASLPGETRKYYQKKIVDQLNRLVQSERAADSTVRPTGGYNPVSNIEDAKTNGKPKKKN